MDLRVAVVTLSGIKALETVPSFAVICVVPAVRPLANPVPALIEAVAGTEEAQVTLVVIFSALRSL